MKNYSGNNKPYIYVSFSEMNTEQVMPLLEKLSSEKVLFWHGEKSTKREQKRVEGAHAVLLFVSQDYSQDENFRKIVDEAVRCNKNILTVYLEDVELDSWGHMQLDSAQALSVKNYSGTEEFYEKLKESAIFRDMKVTVQQKRFRRNTALSAVLIPAISAALVFATIVYPLLIVPAQEQQEELEVFGLKGLTQEELDAITDINIMGTNVYTNVRDVGVSQTSEDGRIGFEVLYNDGTRVEEATERGDISDLSSLKNLKNLKVLRICANSITDLSPLKDCPNLERIVVENNPIRSLEGLENLNNLWELSINYTDIDDLTPIQNLPNLRILCFRFTPVSEIPDMPVMRRIETLYTEGSRVTSIPYLGEHESFGEIVINRQYGEDRIKDYSFLKDIHELDRFSTDNAKIEELKPYLEGKKIREINSAGMDMTSLKELDWLNVTERLDVCHTESLISLEGIEHFEGIEVLVLKGCDNLMDLTPCLKLKSLKVLELYESQRNLAESQLEGAPFEIKYVYD